MFIVSASVACVRARVERGRVAALSSRCCVSPLCALQCRSRRRLLEGCRDAHTPCCVACARVVAGARAVVGVRAPCRISLGRECSVRWWWCAVPLPCAWLSLPPIAAVGYPLLPMLQRRLVAHAAALHRRFTRAVLCCAVLCCAVLCGAVRCGAVRCCAVLCCAVLCCAVRCCAVVCVMCAAGAAGCGER